MMVPSHDGNGSPGLPRAHATAAVNGGSLARWRTAIDEAIAAGGPAMHLQPIVDFANGRIAGFEALARFATAPAAPDQWFNRAHQVGLGPELEASAIAAALTRRCELLPHQFLTVNVSPAALAHHAVQRVLLEQGDLNGVVVELTEHDQIPDRVEVGAAFSLVRGLGGMVAIDDIGTGYAGLEWVLAVRPEMVKLDGEFVRNVHNDEARATFVRFVGDLVDKLDIWLIAEGIETDAELDTIVSLGVPLGQGYRLGRPARDPSALDPELVTRIGRARRTFQLPGDDATAHMEHAPAVRHRADLSGRSVLVDEYHRPIAVFDEPVSAIPVVPPMRVRPGDDLASVVVRALNRPDEERWSPLVVTDGAGRYQGLIRMERLVRALSERRTS